MVKDSVVLDGAGMNQILSIDIENMQATAQCGVPLEILENALREKGYTTGHSPQSKPLAQMGGWLQPAASGNSPLFTVPLKIWSWGWRRCCRTAR